VIFFWGSALKKAFKIYNNFENYSSWEEINIPVFKKPLKFEYYLNNRFFRTIRFEDLNKRLQGNF
jgi:hypothetical protein